jgi:GAF domain-containing protein
VETSKTRGNDVATLCSRCVRETGVDGGGVTVRSSDGVRVTVHATDPTSARIEELQFMLGEGPCVEASDSGEPVLVPDLSRRDSRSRAWSPFLSEAELVGVRAVFAFPLKAGEVALGSLGLYRGSPGPLTDPQLSKGLERAEDLTRSLLRPADRPGVERALPIIVHQAAGMVMVQLDASVDEALLRLRATAFAEELTLQQLARDVVEGRRRFSKEER